MKNSLKSTMTWKEAPDTITPEDLSKILGIGIISARNLFNKKDFPRISKSAIGNQGRADKEAVRLYLQGIRVREQPQASLLNLIYIELKKLNKKLEKNEMNLKEER